MVVWWIWQSSAQPLWSREGLANMLLQWAATIVAAVVLVKLLPKRV